LVWGLGLEVVLRFRLWGFGCTVWGKGFEGFRVRG